jgi:hypothetical protein
MARLAQWAALALAAAAASAAQPAAGPGPLMALLHGHGRGAPAVDLRLDADAAWVAELGAAAGRRLAAAATISGGGHVFVLGVAGSPEAVAAEAAAAAAGGGAPVDLVPAVGAMVLAMQAKFDVQERGDLGTLWNALFWCACLAGAALVLHVALRALVVWRGARMPGFLEYPAVELLLLSALVPIVAAAAAPFYAGTTAGQVAAAVVFGALLPAVYLAFVFYLVVRHVALAEPASRRAVFLLRAPAAAGGAAAAGDGASSAEGSTGSSGGGARASLSESLISGKQSDAPGAGAAAAPAARPTRGARALALLDRFLFIPVFGWRPAEAGEWVDADPASRFTARYGPLFAEVKGPRAELAEDSGAAAAAEGGRGAGRPALRPAPPASRAARARETAQLLGVAVNELKVILFANVLAGASAGADPAAPLALLLAVTAASWAYLRFAAPPATRVDLAVEVLETVCDAGESSCVLELPVEAENALETNQPANQPANH